MVWEDGSTKPLKRRYVRGTRNTSYGEMLVYTIPRWVSTPDDTPMINLTAELPSGAEITSAIARKWLDAMQLMPIMPHTNAP